MNKPQSLRSALNKAVAYVRDNPDKLHLFVDNGSLVATGASSMSWEYRYTLNVVIEASDSVTYKTGEFVVEADTTRINSEVVINGGVTQGGGAMSSNGIVVDKHGHTGVKSGGDTSGGPV